MAFILIRVVYDNFLGIDHPNKKASPNDRIIREKILCRGQIWYSW